MGFFYFNFLNFLLVLCLLIFCTCCLYSSLAFSRVYFMFSLQLLGSLSCLLRACLLCILGGGQHQCLSPCPSKAAQKAGLVAPSHPLSLSNKQAEILSPRATDHGRVLCLHCFELKFKNLIFIVVLCVRTTVNNFLL